MGEKDRDYKFLNCGKSIQNYFTCMENNVAGFTKRFAKKGDIVYFVVNYEKVSYLTAKGLLGEETDKKPWGDAERYIQSFNVDEITYCKPIALGEFKEYFKKLWAIYLQSPKSLSNESKVLIEIEKYINENKIEEYHKFEEINLEFEQMELEVNDNEYIEDIIIEESNEGIINDDKVDIMGTFQTIRFKNETDKSMGLEVLVNDNFYNLFTHFQEENSILICDNRKFKTSSIRNSNNDRVLGVETIPDAIMIMHDKKDKNYPFKINLIEYECYGEGKLRSKDKFEYFNGHIIPQLMRFASNFSIVTDSNIRRDTIDKWIDKVIDYVNESDELRNKIKIWMQNIYPDIKEREVDRRFEKELFKSFESNLRITLIIDELTQEQKDTLSNVVKSFKLDGNREIEFKSYIVRLEQKIGIVDKNASFALSYQE